MRTLVAVCLFALVCGAQNECANLAVSPSSDYAYLIGSAPAGGTYRWLLNGQTYKTGSTPQLLLLHADDSLITIEGKKPLDSPAVAYQPGRWGSALAIEKSGLLTYARGGNLDLNEGSIEMWVAPRAAGDDPVYTQRDHTLFHYRAPNGDRMVIAQSRCAAGRSANGITWPTPTRRPAT